MLPRKIKSAGVTPFIRPYPSANFALIHGPRPILVDAGFGSDAETTLALVEDAGAHPRDLQCLANTHYHAAHVGGNAAFQREGTRIAAHRHDALMINAADREACAADYLGQPVEQYRVDIFLEPEAILETGTQRVHVLNTTGHTLSHLSYLTEDGTLIAGGLIDAMGSVWATPFREGSGAFYRLLDSLHALTDPIVPIRRIVPAHGPLITDAAAAIHAALDQMEAWLSDPQDAARHACHEIARFRLAITGPQPPEAFRAWLISAHWLIDYAKHTFDTDAGTLADELMREMQDSGDAHLTGSLLTLSASHTPAPSGWLSGVPPVSRWRH